MNQYEFTTVYTSDSETMAYDEVKRQILACKNIELISLKVDESERSCRNAYGEELEEEEFDELDPDSDEAWFDDYDIVFKMVISTTLNEEDALGELEKNGIYADYADEELEECANVEEFLFNEDELEFVLGENEIEQNEIERED